MATGLENLKVYTMAENLEVKLHEITKKFPADELFRSIDQVRRSSASVSNNIAEGYARHTFQEKIRYFYIAKGEAEETKRNIIRCWKKDFLNQDIAEKIAEEYTELLKAISGYIRFLRMKKSQQ